MALKLAYWLDFNCNIRLFKGCVGQAGTVVPILITFVLEGKLCWHILCPSGLGSKARKLSESKPNQALWFSFFSCFFFWKPLTLLHFPAKCRRAAPWKRFIWMGSPLPLAWWKWDGILSSASALWRGVRNQWWYALSHQVNFSIFFCEFVLQLQESPSNYKSIVLLYPKGW